MEIFVAMIINGVFGICGLLLVNYLIKTNLYTYVKQAVMAIEKMTPDIAGVEKREQVIKWVRKKYPKFIISDTYLRIIIEAAVGTIKGI